MTSAVISLGDTIMFVVLMLLIAVIIHLLQVGSVDAYREEWRKDDEAIEAEHRED